MWSESDRQVTNGSCIVLRTSRLDLLIWKARFLAIRDESSLRWEEKLSKLAEDAIRELDQRLSLTATE